MTRKLLDRKIIVHRLSVVLVFTCVDSYVYRLKDVGFLERGGSPESRRVRWGGVGEEREMMILRKRDRDRER